MVEKTVIAAKLPDSIPKEELFAILRGDYKSLKKQVVTLGLSEEARRLLEIEGLIFRVDRTKALEILLRERREERRELQEEGASVRQRVSKSP